MIRVENVTKRYGAFLAVNNVSFEVEEGSVVGFLGPNGAGKTTTIRILSCFMPASSGIASIAGFDVFSQSMEVRKRIGYLPESAPLYPDMRVREYLNFRGKLRGLRGSDRQRALGSVAERCWLGDFIDRPIHQLSKGMRQRVGLADALMHDPDVLILDEPTVGLDPTQIRETRKLIKELGERHTILFSSHILPEVENVCSHMIVIAGGCIVTQGAISDLRSRFEASDMVAEIKAPAEEASRALAGLQHVTNVTPVHTNGEWCKLGIEAKSGTDVRESVFKLIVDKGWSMREMATRGGTLEDFFIKVTAEQARYNRDHRTA